MELYEKLSQVGEGTYGLFDIYNDESLTVFLEKYIRRGWPQIRAN